MVERVQMWLRRAWDRHPWLLPLSGAYIVSVLVVRIGVIFSGSDDLYLALWFACAPLSGASGPYELLLIWTVGDLLGETAAQIVDVFWWVMLATVQTLGVWGALALARNRKRCRFTRATTVQP
ncbi:hypothetical protein ACQPZJ_30435 [Actinoplanes sp. CA-054009]